MVTVPVTQNANQTIRSGTQEGYRFESTSRSIEDPSPPCLCTDNYVKRLFSGSVPGAYSCHASRENHE
jgi:hypothetical protein